MSSSTELSPAAGGWSRLAPAGAVGDTAMEATLLDVADRARDAARAQGYAVGWAQGRREAARVAAEAAAEVARTEEAAAQRREAEHREALEALGHAAAELRSLLDSTSARLEAQGTRLAWELTTALVGHEVRTAGGADAVDRVLALAPVGEIVRVRLHPDHVPSPDQASGAAVERLTELGARVVSDPALGRLDALVELTEGILDLRIDTALERVREVLRPDDAAPAPVLEPVLEVVR